jgi:hypothetical protein
MSLLKHFCSEIIYSVQIIFQQIFMLHVFSEPFRDFFNKIFFWYTDFVC